MDNPTMKDIMMIGDAGSVLQLCEISMNEWFQPLDVQPGTVEIVCVGSLPDVY